MLEVPRNYPLTYDCVGKSKGVRTALSLKIVLGEISHFISFKEKVKIIPNASPLTRHSMETIREYLQLFLAEEF